MPQNCKWIGGLDSFLDQANSCYGNCAYETQFLLNTDSYNDALGVEICPTGERTLCCDATKILEQCYWSDCQGPDPNNIGGCLSNYTQMTTRWDTGSGRLFSRDPVPNEVTADTVRTIGETCAAFENANDPNDEYLYSQAFCCPTAGKSPSNDGFLRIILTYFDRGANQLFVDLHEQLSSWDSFGGRSRITMQPK